MAKAGNGFTCYDAQSVNKKGQLTGKAVPCLTSKYYDVATSTPGVAPLWTSNAVAGPGGYAGANRPAAANAGATWDSLWKAMPPARSTR